MRSDRTRPYSNSITLIVQCYSVLAEEFIDVSPRIDVICRIIDFNFELYFKVFIFATDMTWP